MANKPVSCEKACQLKGFYISNLFFDEDCFRKITGALHFWKPSMNDTEHNIAGSVEDGTYYISARRWYSEIFHSPIAERNYYIIILALALVNLLLAFDALVSIFPIAPGVPLPIYSNNIWEELPRIKKLARSSSEDRNIAVMRYMIDSYVINRESYDLKSYEMRYRNIWSESTPQEFEEYKRHIDASNPLSPYRQYTDLARRDINIVSTDYTVGPKISHARVIFTDSVVSVVTGREVRHTKWEAEIAYEYTGFKVDQSLNTKNPVAVFLGLTGNTLKGSGERRKITPMKFVVSDYQLKELLE